MRKRRKYKQKSGFKKFMIAFIAIIILGGGGMAYELYSRVYQANIVFTKDSDDKYIYIPTESSFLDVVTILSENGLLINANSFEWLAKQKRYDTNIKPGRYKIDRALNNNELVNLLRSANQTPIKVTFNNLRTKEDLAGNIASQIEADSVSIMECITDVVFQQQLGLNNDNVVCIFLPNTYEFYWNTSAEGFVNRMLKEYHNFWNEDRRIKSENIGLDYHQVSVLASIVEKEQNIRKDERPRIAGLYLNRLNNPLLFPYLQADPTVKFAIKDFSIKQVLNKHTSFDNPYNTYKYKGLPPGPICIPSINAIDAVLGFESHNYYFMCAGDGDGYHKFTSTNFEHVQNKREYKERHGFK